MSDPKPFNVLFLCTGKSARSILPVLAGKGQRIMWGQHMKVGLILTSRVPLAAMVALWMRLPISLQLVNNLERSIWVVA